MRRLLCLLTLLLCGSFASAIPCEDYLSGQHNFTRLMESAFTQNAVSSEMIRRTADSMIPVNPYAGSSFQDGKIEAFQRGFDLLLQSPSLAGEWPLVVLELRELYVVANRRPVTPVREMVAGNLAVREVYRVTDAHSLSPPVFTTDRNGIPIFAYINDAGEVRVHTLGRRNPIWKFPPMRVPLPGELQFVQLTWHTNSEGTPLLLIYWVPLHRPPYGQAVLYRAIARLHDNTSYLTETRIPHGGFLEAVHSLGLGQEFVQWTPMAGVPAKLIDFNAPKRTLDVHDNFSRGNLILDKTGHTLVARVVRDEVEVLRFYDGQWLSLWRQHCGQSCVEATLYQTSSGQIWVALYQAGHHLVLQDIRRPATRHVRQFSGAIGDTPRFFEAADGRLLLFVELEGSSNWHQGKLLAVDARDSEAHARTLTSEGVFYLQSSQSFSPNPSREQYLGLITANGLEIYNVGLAQGAPRIGRLDLTSAGRVGWLTGAQQQLLGHAGGERHPDIIVFQLFNVF